MATETEEKCGECDGKIDPEDGLCGPCLDAYLGGPSATDDCKGTGHGCTAECKGEAAEQRLK